MAPFIRIAADLRAILATQATLQLVDRRVLRSPDDIECDGLVSDADEAANLKVSVTGVKRIADGRGMAGPAPGSRASSHSRL